MTLRHAAVAAGVLLFAGRPLASGLQIAPVLVELGARSPSSTITVHNAGTTPMRYQVSAMAWTEPEGKEQLAPSADLAAFPPLFSLGPGEERRIRVGATVAPTDEERAWRLFVEELPAPADRAADGPRIAFRMRFAIPVFLAPLHPRAAGTATLARSGATLQVAIRNLGNVHLRPTQISVGLLGGAGDVVKAVDVPPLNVLVGSERTFEVPVPPERCASIRRAAVTVDLPNEKLRAALALPDGACAP